MRKIRMFVGVLALLSLFAASCGSNDNKSSSTTSTGSSSPGTSAGGAGEECTAERVGGSATMGVYSEAKGLDPTITGGTGRTGDTELAAIYDTLLRYNPDTGAFEPWVAESLESTDKKVWTLKLRPDVKYGNGDTLSAADVQANIERTKLGKNATTKSLATQVESMTVVDPLTLTITLNSPFGGFPGVLAGGTGMIVNPRVVASMDPDAFNLMPTGAGVGPYEPVRFAAGEEITMKARTDYWGGPVCIQDLRFIFVAGARATYDALRNNEIQAGFLREPIVIDEAKSAGYDGFSQIQNAGEALAMNSGVKGSTPATSIQKVRQAVVLALNPTMIDDRANDGKGLPSPNLIYPDSRLYPGVDGVSNQPDQAKQLVEEAKAEGWNGKIRFLCDTAPYRQEEAIAIQAMLQAAGFDVELENNVTISDLVTRVLVDGNFDLACWGLNVNDENPWVGLDQFRSDSASNYSGYKNATVDTAIAALRVAGDEGAAKKALGAIQEAWNTDPAVAALGAFENYVAWDESLHGLVPSASTMVLFSKAYIAK